MEAFTLSLTLASTAPAPQRLVVDYAVHYVKKSGAASVKAFKWKEVTLAADESLTLTRRQTIWDFTTRVHYPGRHHVKVHINGTALAGVWFDLECP